MAKVRKASRIVGDQRVFTMGPIADGSYIVRAEPRRPKRVRGHFGFMAKGETLREGLTIEEANRIVESGVFQCQCGECVDVAAARFCEGVVNADDGAIC